MITIEQLLESVDLDFEPRWVTKDKDGWITIWGEKPHCYSYGDSWHNNTSPDLECGYVKLADFKNKGWQECIYEVPRKVETVSSKIKKLENVLMKYTFNETEYETSTVPSLENFMDKINELIDAVNELKGAK